MASNRQMTFNLRTVLLLIAAVIGAIFFVHFVIGTLFLVVKIIFVLIFLGVVFSFYTRGR